MKVLGCDPGKQGAFALIDTEAWTIAITDMPREPGSKGKSAVSPGAVGDIVRAAKPDYTFLEDVHSSPQMGVTSAFSFGRSLGIVQGASAAVSVLTQVRPQEWKKRTGTPTDKNEARRRAMQLFPSARDLFKRVMDDGRAEACLIAFYGLLYLQAVPPKALKYVEFPA